MIGIASLPKYSGIHEFFLYYLVVFSTPCIVWYALSHIVNRWLCFMFQVTVSLRKVNIYITFVELSCALLRLATSSISPTIVVA